MAIDESAMEAFLTRLVPGFRDECKGAGEQDIRRLEEIAGQPLPNFYDGCSPGWGATLGLFGASWMGF